MDGNDSEEGSPAKNVAKSSKNSTTVSTTTAPTTAQPTIVQIAQTELKIDVDAEAEADANADIDMLDSVFITGPGDLLDADGLCNEFLPTITSVTSLHPSKFNELFETSKIESGNIL